MNYKLYIGLNVADGKDWERQDAVNIIINICKAKGITAVPLYGGARWYHNRELWKP